MCKKSIQAIQIYFYFQWYAIQHGELPEEICAKFVQGLEDEETKEFLQNSYDKTDAVFYQISHTFLRGVLGWFLTPTTING